MVKEEIIREVSNDTGYNKQIVSAIVEATLTAVIRALSRGNRVVFAGFGVFKAQQRSARIGRNPHTGETVHIPERTIPKFSAGKRLMASMKGVDIDEKN